MHRKVHASKCSADFQSAVSQISNLRGVIIASAPEFRASLTLECGDMSPLSHWQTCLPVCVPNGNIEQRSATTLPYNSRAKPPLCPIFRHARPQPHTQRSADFQSAVSQISNLHGGLIQSDGQIPEREILLPLRHEVGERWCLAVTMQLKLLGSAAASAAVRRASRRTGRRGKSLNGGFISSVSVRREGATHCARGRAHPNRNAEIKHPVLRSAAPA
jgi:hypothetical protein